MDESDIQVGKTYRAKRPVKYPFGEYNDRCVLWISKDRQKVQYDGPTVKVGAHYPTVPMENFLKWAGKEVEVDE